MDISSDDTNVLNDIHVIHDTNVDEVNAVDEMSLKRQNAALLMFMYYNLYDYEKFSCIMLNYFNRVDIGYKKEILSFLKSKIYDKSTREIFIRAINKLLNIIKTCHTLDEYDKKISYFGIRNIVITESSIKSDKPRNVKLFSIYTFLYTNNYIFNYAFMLRQLYTSTNNF